MRTALTLGSLLVLSALAACGGSDGDGGGGQAASVDTASAAEVTACLTDAGFTVTESVALTDDVKKVLGIEDSLSISGDGEHVGLGSVTWYKDAKTAADAHEDGAAVRTEDVAREVVGVVTYDFAGVDRAGSDAAAAIIADCL